MKEILKRVQISGVFVAFVLIVIVASLVSPYFLTSYNLQSVIRSLAFVALVSIGQACLLLIGEIDLSVGAIAGLCGVIGGLLMVNAGVNPYLAMLICLGMGALFGLLNGLLVTGLNLNSLVVTIGTQGI